jgi:hypothetical protein
MDLLALFIDPKAYKACPIVHIPMRSRNMWSFFDLEGLDSGSSVLTVSKHMPRYTSLGQASPFAQQSTPLWQLGNGGYGWAYGLELRVLTQLAANTSNQKVGSEAEFQAR